MRTPSMQQDITVRDAFANATRITIKVGTNSLIDVENWVVKHKWLERSVASWIKLDKELGIVTSGAIGMARVLHNYPKPNSLGEKQAYAAIGQGPLYRLYEHAFAKQGVITAQTLVSKRDFFSREGQSTYRETLSNLRRLNAVPITNENDSVANEEIKIGDNDKTSGYQAVSDDADAVVILTDTRLYDKNPKLHPNAQPVAILHELNHTVMASAGDTVGDHGTGGMITKLHAAYIAAARGINVFIVDASEAECLEHILKGKTTHVTFIPHTAFRDLGQDYNQFLVPTLMG